VQGFESILVEEFVLDIEEIVCWWEFYVVVLLRQRLQRVALIRFTFVDLVDFFLEFNVE
jgi:hypothetical protein